MFLERLENAAKKKCVLDRGSPVLMGVSGGADSLALMHGLYSLKFTIIVAHLDHAIRPESSQDADFVEGLATSWQLPFVRKRVLVQSVADDERLSLEEAARVVRYRFLFEQAEIHGAQAVAVAHHADDQVETILMHFIRGAGLDGLSGMSFRRIIPQWSQAIPLVRPLLGIWREEIDAYLLDAGLSPRIDSTNKDTTYFRNRLRHDIIPALEALNPQFRQVIWRTTDVLSEENRYLYELAQTSWSDCLIAQTEHYVSLKREAFNAMPKVLKRRVLRRAISLLRPGLRDIGFDTVELGIASMEGSEVVGEIDLAAKLNLAILEDVVILKTWDSALPDWGKPLLPSTGFHVSVNVEDVVELQNDWLLKAEEITLVPEELEGLEGTVKALSENEAWLDYDRLTLPLKLRGRKPGERWQPLGMAGRHQKLQDFFINQKIPAHLRDTWPLIVSGKNIAWVVGLRPSEMYKISRQTRRVLYLSLLNKQD